MRKYSDPIEFLNERYPNNLHQCMIEITNKCNFNCLHCYNVDTCNPPIEMSSQLFTEAITQIEEMGVPFISLTGGEPFTHGSILSFIKEICKRNIFLKILTNGSLLDKEAIRIIRENHVQMSISLYGMSEKTYHAVTGLDKMFSVVINNINCLIENGIDVLLKYLITKDSLNDVDLAREYAKRNNIKISFDYSITPRNDGNMYPVYTCMLEQDQIKQILLSTKDYFPYEGFVDENAYVCDAARNKLYISPSGDVYPCVQYRLVLDNITKSRISNIYKEYLSTIGMIKMKDTECFTCELLGYCVPLCIGLNSVFKKSVLSCNYSKHVLAQVKKSLFEESTYKHE